MVDKNWNGKLDRRENNVHSQSIFGEVSKKVTPRDGKEISSNSRVFVSLTKNLFKIVKK